MRQILFEAGVLKNTNFVECSRETLISMYIGETAIKTKKAIDEAMGGVLFVDEAYALGNNSSINGTDYGKEAIDILVVVATYIFRIFFVGSTLPAFTNHHIFWLSFFLMATGDIESHIVKLPPVIFIPRSLCASGKLRCHFAIKLYILTERFYCHCIVLPISMFYVVIFKEDNL